MNQMKPLLLMTPDIVMLMPAAPLVFLVSFCLRFVSGAHQDVSPSRIPSSGGHYCCSFKMTLQLVDWVTVTAIKLRNIIMILTLDIYTPPMSVRTPYIYS